LRFLPWCWCMCYITQGEGFEEYLNGRSIRHQLNLLSQFFIDYVTSHLPMHHPLDHDWVTKGSTLETSVRRFSLFVKTINSSFWASFEITLMCVFLKKNSHFENCLGFHNSEKNLVMQFSRLLGFTKFWTVNFQRCFSQVDSHKSRFFVFHIYIYIYSWIENWNYDCPLEQTPISF